MLQKDVAKVCNISQSTLSKLEMGARKPSISELEKLADLYGKPISYFFPPNKKKTLNFTENDIATQIDYYGYGLLISHAPTKTNRRLSCDDTIFEIIDTFTSPRFIEALPTLFYYNDIDADYLYDKAWRSHIQNRLGFIVSVTIECLKPMGLKSRVKEMNIFLKKLESIKLAREDSFCEDVNSLSSEVLKYLKDTRDPIARKWNILDRFYLKEFLEVFHNAILAKTA